MPSPFRGSRLKRSLNLLVLGAGLLGGIATPAMFAASSVTYDSKQSATDYSIQEPVVEIPVARASRGNVTLEGPSGMFLNPTSATLPQGTFASGYCAVLTNQDTVILGHSMFMSYGVRDWLELGVVANMFNFTESGLELPEGDYGTGGPMARVRLLRDIRWWPEVSVGGYAKF